MLVLWASLFCSTVHWYTHLAASPQVQSALRLGTRLNALSIVPRRKHSLRKHNFHWTQFAPVLQFFLLLRTRGGKAEWSSWDREFFPGRAAGNDDSQVEESTKRAGRGGRGKDVAGECLWLTFLYGHVHILFQLVSVCRFEICLHSRLLSSPDRFIRLRTRPCTLASLRRNNCASDNDYGWRSFSAWNDIATILLATRGTRSVTPCILLH